MTLTTQLINQLTRSMTPNKAIAIAKVKVFTIRLAISNQQSAINTVLLHGISGNTTPMALESANRRFSWTKFATNQLANAPGHGHTSHQGENMNKKLQQKLAAMSPEAKRLWAQDDEAAEKDEAEGVEALYQQRNLPALKTTAIKLASLTVPVKLVNAHVERPLPKDTNSLRNQLRMARKLAEKRKASWVRAADRAESLAAELRKREELEVKISSCPKAGKNGISKKKAKTSVIPGIDDAMAAKILEILTAQGLMK